MSNTNAVDMTSQQETKATIVTPTSKAISLFENADYRTILDLSIDVNNEDDENSTPLDFRRDWSEDLDDIDGDDKGERPTSTELYEMLQKTIATIDPDDDFSDLDADDASCDSLPKKIPSDVFSLPSDKNIECQRNKLLKALYHDRSNNVVENDSMKRRKLN